MTEEKKEPTKTKKKIVKKKIIKKKKVIRKNPRTKPDSKVEPIQKAGPITFYKNNREKNSDKRLDTILEEAKPSIRQEKLQKKFDKFFGKPPEPEPDKRTETVRTKCNQELINNITRYVKAGSFIETACLMNGISRSTFEKWVKLGRKLRDETISWDVKLKINPIYEKFVDEIDLANAQAEIRYTEIIDYSADNNWNAAAWMLSRRFSKRWGNMGKVAVEGKIEGEINHTHEHTLTIEEKKEAIEKIMCDDDTIDAAFKVLQALDGSSPDNFYGSEEAQKVIESPDNKNKESENKEHGN